MSQRARPGQARPGQSIREIRRLTGSCTVSKQRTLPGLLEILTLLTSSALDLCEPLQPSPLFILFRHFVLGPVHSSPMSSRLICQGPREMFSKTFSFVCSFEFFFNFFVPTPLAGMCHVPHPPLSQLGVFPAQIEMQNLNVRGPWLTLCLPCCYLKCLSKEYHHPTPLPSTPPIW